MARTGKKLRRRGAVTPGPQAPEGVWTPDELMSALTSGTVAEKVALLSKFGILDKKGNLAKIYRTWGNKPSRTPEE